MRRGGEPVHRDAPAIGQAVLDATVAGRDQHRLPLRVRHRVEIVEELRRDRLGERLAEAEAQGDDVTARHPARPVVDRRLERLGDVALLRPDHDVELGARRERAGPLGVEQHLDLLPLVGEDAGVGTREDADGRERPREEARGEGRDVAVEKVAARDDRDRASRPGQADPLETRDVVGRREVTRRERRHPVRELHERPELRQVVEPEDAAHGWDEVLGERRLGERPVMDLPGTTEEADRRRERRLDLRRRSRHDEGQAKR